MEEDQCSPSAGAGGHSSGVSAGRLEENLPPAATAPPLLLLLAALHHAFTVLPACRSGGEPSSCSSCKGATKNAAGPASVQMGDKLNLGVVVKTGTSQSATTHTRLPTCSQGDVTVRTSKN